MFFIIAACVLQELLVRIHLPGVQRAQQAQLKVELQTLSLHVAGKYTLRLPLPCAVREADSTARFNGSKHELEVTLPVVLQPTSVAAVAAVTGGVSIEQPLDSRDLAASDRGTGGVIEAASSSQQAATADTSASTASAVSSSSGAVISEALQTSSSHSQLQEQGNSAQLGSNKPSLTDNQRKWLGATSGSLIQRRITA